MTSTSEAEQVTGWGRELGVHLRALRRLAGLSQGRLASIVGTSQPSLSRLERGYVAKQVLLVIGVAQVITRALSRFDEMALREETRTLLRALDTLSAGLPMGSSVARDTGLEELVHLYRDASPRQRRGMLAIVRAWRASPRDAGDPDSSVGGAGE
jgi:transcriptional regulator with XRE-family HTH domain